ncbi:MAG: proline dehydrogenase family protein [Candidatus Limnocylindrales bacterium]
MRRVLLWMARNHWLRDHLPRLPFAKRAVRRFMPGETKEDAFAAGDLLMKEDIGILYTHLGENLTEQAQADEVAEHYKQVLDAVAGKSKPPEISVKPTQLGLDIDPERSFQHASMLATYAKERGSWLWLDMEGSPYVDPTLDQYERLKADHDNVGICLQAYLKRTAADVQRLLPLKPAIRLVKGAYSEPASIAFKSKDEVNASYLTLAVTIAEAAGQGNARLALGTHDVELVAKITDAAKATGTAKSALEVHMLYGIRTDELRKLRDKGYPAFDLVAYGEAWYAWYMRRLAERPANVGFALRQLLP